MHFSAKYTGPSIYDVQKNQVFDPPPLSTCVHMSQTPSRGRQHPIDMKYISLSVMKRLVQWPYGPKGEIQLFDCNLFKIVLLVIFITNLYRWKISTVYSVLNGILVKKDTNVLAWEEDRMTSRDSNFNFLCERLHGASPSSPRPHASTLAWPPSPSVWTS